MNSTEHSIDGICIPFLTSFLPFGLVLLQKGIFFLSEWSHLCQDSFFHTVLQHVCRNPSATIELCTPFLKGRPFQDLHVKKVLGKKKRVSCCAGDSQAFKPWQHCWRFVRAQIFSHCVEWTRVPRPLHPVGANAGKIRVPRATVWSRCRFHQRHNGVRLQQSPCANSVRPS